ncbi:hypothetical protein J2766_001150 [Agrobacterium tumefaciens]|nr:hypothetical protein [Agrobacterium tumefaciens]
MSPIGAILRPGEPSLSKTCFEERSAAAIRPIWIGDFPEFPVIQPSNGQVFLIARFVALVALVSAGGSLAGKLSSRLSVKSSSLFLTADFCSFSSDFTAGDLAFAEAAFFAGIFFAGAFSADAFAAAGFFTPFPLLDFAASASAESSRSASIQCLS